MSEPVSIQVGGNVEGSIVVGDHNFVVNTNHGTIVYKQTAPQVRPRQYAPQPPRPPRDFVDRTAELATLEARMAAHEIVLIHAPDGMGKSSLLKQAANSAAARALPDGVILLESVDADGQALGPADLIQSMFDALFESDPPLKVDAVSARTYLSNTRPLLLLDEVGLSPALQKTLPDLFPQGAILLTADLPLAGDFERLPIGPLPRHEAVNLLAARADLTLTNANRPTLDALCALLNDVSLAIVITANVMRETHTSPQAALQTVQGISVSTPDPVLAALDRAFAFAFGILTPEQRQVLSAAALTPGVSMTPDWLAAALPGLDVQAPLERLKLLGLLFANSPRLRLPAGFRGPARRASVLEEATLLPRLVEFLSAPLRQNPQDWEHIGAEIGNFFGALGWAFRSHRWADVLTLGRALDPYLSLHGLWDAWGATLGYLLEAARQAGEQPVLAWALHQSGVREIGVGTPRHALELLRQALELRRVLGDTVGMAYTRHNIDLLVGPPPPGEHASKPSGSGNSPGRPAPPFAMATVLGALVIVALAVLVGIAVLRTPPITPAPYIPPPGFTATIDPTITPTPSPRPVVTPPGGSDLIVFQVSGQSPALAQNPASLYTIHTDGSGVSRLLDFPAQDPAWSPDGKKLAFASRYGSDYIRIFVADAHGSKPQALPVDAPLNETHPAWSPDGSLIAFTGTDANLRSDIYTVMADGSNLANLSATIEQNVDYPEWSPDGSRIAFQTLLDGNWQIFVMNADGSDPAQLTSESADVKGGANLYPAWSPDGKRIAFASNRAANWNIYTMDAQGHNVQALTSGPFTELFPDWSPDGRLIVFSSNRDGPLQLYRVADDGSGIMLLATLPGIPVAADWQPGQP